MQLIKEKIRSIGGDVSIKLPLSTTSKSNGLQQEISNFVNSELGLSINPVVDGERIRFLSQSVFSIRTYFRNNSNVLVDNYIGGDIFTNEEVESNSNVKTNSFYIFQIYDSISSANQTLLHNSYINGTDLPTNPNQQDTFKVFSINQGEILESTNFYFPEWWLNQTDSNTITFYFKLLFFDAKKGKLRVFYNRDKENVTSEDKLFVEGTLFKNTKKYLLQSQMKFNEFEDSSYTNRINNSLSKFNNELPQFPVGSQFNPDGTYKITT